MATITINIPDNNIADVRDAICEAYGYTTDSGMTKTQFAKRVVADFVKEIYKSQMGAKAADLARKQVIDQVNLIDIN